MNMRMKPQGLTKISCENIKTCLRQRKMFGKKMLLIAILLTSPVVYLFISHLSLYRRELLFVQSSSVGDNSTDVPSIRKENAVIVGVDKDNVLDNVGKSIKPKNIEQTISEIRITKDKMNINSINTPVQFKGSSLKKETKVVRRTAANETGLTKNATNKAVVFLKNNTSNKDDLPRVSKPNSGERAKSTTNNAAKIIQNKTDNHWGYLGNSTGQDVSMRFLKGAQMCDKMKFVVFVCSPGRPCGGLADRERGMISTYLLSLLMKRFFVINFNKPCDISNFLEPNEHNWRICHDYINAVPKTAANSPDSLKVESVLKRNNFEIWNNETVIFIRTNRYWIQQIAHHPKALELLPFVVNKSIPIVCRIVLARLFQPSIELGNAIRNFTDKYVGSKQLICSHIRTGKNPTIPNDTERSVPNITIIFNWLRRFYNSRKYSIYIASDSETVKELAKRNFTNVVTSDGPIIHVDRIREDQNNIACLGLFYAILEQHILSICDTILLTRSNFGPMAVYMSKKTQRIFMFKWQGIFEISFQSVQKLF